MRTTCRFARWLFASGAMLVGACDAASVPSEDTTVDIADETEPTRELAWRYLFEEVDDAGAQAIIDQVRDLSAPELRIWADELKVLGDADEWQASAFDQLVEVAISSDRAPFDLGADVVEAVLDGAVPDDNFRTICAPLWFSCTVWIPNPATTLYGGSCAAGCTRATSVNRWSTNACEFGGCDYRFTFPIGGKSMIDGRTAAYDTWILQYAGILGQNLGGTTYAVLGQGGALASGIFIVSASNFQVY